jgi:hypothetical protein
MTRHLALAASIAFIVSCGGGGEGPTGPTTPGLHVIAGASISDTVLARPVQALVVEVRPISGSPAGLVVRFESLPSSDSTRPYERAIAVSNLASNFFVPFISDTTNSSGRASALVQLGTVAGEARVLVTCPELGFSDTAKFTVLPGNPDRVVVRNRDTTVLAGAMYTINAYASDRFLNRRSDPVTFTPGANTTSVDPSGRVTVATTVGRGNVAVRAGNALDSARFTVLPSGAMAFFDATDGTVTVSTAKMDGSGRKRLASTVTPSYPNISPDGSLVVYQEPAGSAVINLVDASANKRQLTTPSTMTWAYYPHFSGDGQWVFFSGLAVGDTTAAIWRIHPDGTSLTRVIDLNNAPLTANLGIAPDGTRIAYSENYQFTIMQLSTGAKVPLGAGGTFIEFSPDSKRVAYLGGNYINVVNVDGTSPIKLAADRVQGDAGLTWTPDGGWLLVRGYGGPLLISAATGEVISLPFPDFYQFSATR